MTDPDNLFDLPTGEWRDEIFEILHQSAHVRIERILSRGHRTPPGEFYDQERDEWVVLLQGQARIDFDDGSARQLESGDHLLIPKHVRHRVGHTSTEPPCVWLAVHVDTAT